MFTQPAPELWISQTLYSKLSTPKVPFGMYRMKLFSMYWIVPREGANKPTAVESTLSESESGSVSLSNTGIGMLSPIKVVSLSVAATGGLLGGLLLFTVTLTFPFTHC